MKDDGLYDANENILVGISSVTNANTTIAQPGSSLGFVTINIADAAFGAPEVSMTLDKSIIPESGGISVLSFNLDEFVADNVSISLSTSGTAAGAGVDYTLLSPVIIPAGQLTTRVNLKSIEDLIDENNCGFSVQPNNPRDLANALIQASENRETLIKMGRNARDLAETKFNRDKLALDWMNWVLVNQKNMRSKNA